MPSTVLKNIAICKKSIKARVYKNPTEEAKKIYSEEADRIRDTLDEATQAEFDQEFPTLNQMRPSIYGWRRDVILTNPHTMCVMYFVFFFCVLVSFHIFSHKIKKIRKSHTTQKMEMQCM